jgi:ABC-type phosphate transport system permease subunit
MASLIANQFSEATNDLHLSALMAVGAVLFVVTLIVNAIARWLVWRGYSGARDDEEERETREERCHAWADLCRRRRSRRLPLLLILIHLIREGAKYIRPAFFTEMPRPVGEAGGGMANAIVGTLILISIASVIGLPIGIGAGLYLAEKRGNMLATVVRFLSDVLNGLPSIVLGIFAWQFLVRPVGHFSALAEGWRLER